MKKHTNEKRISVAEFARISNLSERRIYQLAEERIIPSIEDGKLPLLESIQAILKHYQKVPEETAKERLALVKANRELKEHELAITQKKFVGRDIAQNTLTTGLRRYHDFVRSSLEINAPAARKDKLQALGMAGDALQHFNTWDVAQSIETINRIEQQCEDFGKSANTEAE